MNREDDGPVTVVKTLDDKTITIIFKPEWRPGKLLEEEKQLLLAYRGEILAEIAAEEKRIIAEERKAQRQKRVKTRSRRRKTKE